MVISRTVAASSLTVTATAGSIATTVSMPDRYPLPAALIIVWLGVIVAVVFRVLDYVQRRQDREHEHVERLAMINKALPEQVSELAVTWAGKPVTITTSRTTEPQVPSVAEAGAVRAENQPPAALRPTG